jgi:hypothetical protein
MSQDLCPFDWWLGHPFDGGRVGELMKLESSDTHPQDTARMEKPLCSVNMIPAWTVR